MSCGVRHSGGWGRGGVAWCGGASCKSDPRLSINVWFGEVGFGIFYKVDDEEGETLVIQD